MIHIFKRNLLFMLSIFIVCACTDKTKNDVVEKQSIINSSDAPDESSGLTDTEVTETNAAPSFNDTAEIEGIEYTVTGRPSGCILSAENGRTFKLDLAENCQFHRLENNEVQIRKGHHGPVFIVKSQVERDAANECNFRTAPVTISNNKTYVEDVVNEGSLCWGNYPMDDIFFLAPRFDGLQYPSDEYKD